MSIGKTADEAAAAAERMSSQVALKAIAPGVIHKTEAGGVHLNLRGAEPVRVATQKMAAKLTALGHSLTGFLIQRMAETGVEMIVGVVHDPQFGPVVVWRGRRSGRAAAGRFCPPNAAGKGRCIGNDSHPENLSSAHWLSRGTSVRRGGFGGWTAPGERDGGRHSADCGTRLQSLCCSRARCGEPGPSGAGHSRGTTSDVGRAALMHAVSTQVTSLRTDWHENFIALLEGEARTSSPYRGLNRLRHFRRVLEQSYVQLGDRGRSRLFWS